MGELSTERKNAWLARVAERLEAARDRIMAANARDVAAAAEKGVPEPMRNRLGISDGKWADMLQGLHDVIALPDPVGRITNHSVRPNGLRVGQMAIPLGVICHDLRVAAQRHGRRGGALREGGQRRDPARRLARPSTRIRRSARSCARRPATSAFPRTRSRSCPTTDRAAIDVLLRAHRLRSISSFPRGGAGLIRKVMAESTIPVIAHDAGVCHIFIDESAPTPRWRVATRARVEDPPDARLQRARDAALPSRRRADRLARRA